MSPSWIHWGSWSDHLHTSSPYSQLLHSIQALGESASGLTHPGQERPRTYLTSGQDHDRKAGRGGGGQVKSVGGWASSHFPFQLVSTNF